MAKKVFVNIRVDFNARTHFATLSEQLEMTESSLLNELSKKFCKPEYYEAKGLFNRTNWSKG